jgi:leucyl aminopeptidase
MSGLVLTKTTKAAIPLALLRDVDFPNWLRAQPAPIARWVTLQQFKAAKHSFVLIPNADGTLAGVAVGVGAELTTYSLSHLPTALPMATYALAADLTDIQIEKAALGWLLGSYRFNKYRQNPPALPDLQVQNKLIAAKASSVAAAVCAARDRVNTPTEDLGPADLAKAAGALARQYRGQFKQIVGAELLRRNFPAIHAVGRASHREPRLIELVWGKPKHPEVVIIGKGVCFDTGGLDMKTSDGMAIMKKDMGGAAVALSLAQLVMTHDLPIRLRLLIPAVENAIGPNAYRPGEVINTRKGLRVEIGNTDAEGRVILCDALTYAAEKVPELILDFATLTGAARIALGPDLPALFSNTDSVADGLLAAGKAVSDPLWRMPLWDDYQRLLESKIADLNNAGSSRMAGAVTAALYLKRFVPDVIPWAHVDTYCWNDSARPGRPQGGECQALRAAFTYLQRRFSTR